MHGRIARTLACLMGLWMTQGVLAQGEESLREFLAETRSMSANFTQRVEGLSQRDVSMSHGQMRLLRPNFLYWEYRGDAALTLVSDGRNFWTYDPLLMQATVTPLAEALEQSPFSTLMSDRNWEAKFAIIKSWPHEGTDWVALQPRSGEASTGAMILGFEDGQLVQLEFMDALGQKVLIEWTHLRLNDSMNPKDFRYTPPPGADILGQVLDE